MINIFIGMMFGILGGLLARLLIYVYEKIKINKQVKEITGWNNPAEWQAYEQGREDEQEVVMKWIAKWDGESNSGLGALINAKITALTNGDFEPIDTNQTLIL